MSDLGSPGSPGHEPLDEVGRRLRRTFARRAEDMAPGDGGAPDAAPGWDLVDVAPATTLATTPVGSPFPRPRRARVALAAAVAAVVLPLVAGAVLLARGEEGAPPAGPAVPLPSTTTTSPPPATTEPPPAQTPSPTTAPATTTTVPVPPPAADSRAEAPPEAAPEEPTTTTVP